MKKLLSILLLTFILLFNGCAGIPPLKNTDLNGSKKPNINQVVVINPALTNSIKLNVSKLSKDGSLEIRVIIPETKTTINIPEDPKILSTRFLIFWYGTLLLGFAGYFLFHGRKTTKIHHPVVNTTTKTNTVVESTVSTPPVVVTPVPPEPPKVP